MHRHPWSGDELRLRFFVLATIYHPNPVLWRPKSVDILPIHLSVKPVSKSVTKLLRSIIKPIQSWRDINYALADHGASRGKLI